MFGHAPRLEHRLLVKRWNLVFTCGQSSRASDRLHLSLRRLHRDCHFLLEESLVSD